MTSILAKNSDKKIESIPEQDLVEIKNDITLLVNDLKALQGEDAKERLSSVGIGTSRNSLLHLAAAFGDEENLAEILQIIAGDQSLIDSRNGNSFTALHLAARNGFANIVKFLIEAGANKNSAASQEHRQWTPIHYAAKHGHVEAVKILIQSGVDKETKTGFGLTPLLISTEFGKLDLVKFLLSIGAERNVRTTDENYNMNALHYAAVGGHLDIVRVLLNAKIDRNKNTSIGFSALDFAAKIDDADVASLLLIWGVGKMENALAIAAQNEDSKVVPKIKKYLAAKKNLFNANWLSENEERLLEILKSFNRENLDEANFNVDEASFNAYGILALESEFGFFKKQSKSFLEFCREKNLTRLSVVLEGLKKLLD